MSEIPDHWEIITLEDCLEAIIDYRGKTPQKSSTGIPLLSAKVIKGGKILEELFEFLPAENYDAWMRRGLPKPGDVVMTTEGPLGEIAQLDSRKYALGQRIVTLRGKQGLLDNGYLKYVMQSAFIQNQLHARATGTTVLGIKQRDLRKIGMLVPPLDEQREIANTLGTLDDKIDLNRRMNATLQETARALFKSWFVDFDPVRAKSEGRDPDSMDAETAALFPDSFEESELGLIPRGWRVSAIGDEVKVVGGSTPSTKEAQYWDDGIFAWATPKDLSNLSVPVLLETDRQITEAGLSQISSGLLPDGTVLLSSRAPIGYLAIAETPVAINQGFIAMICDKALSNHYVLRWAETSMDIIKGNANGTTFQEISKGNFRPIFVLVPPLEILDAFNMLAAPLHEEIVNNERESRTLAETRDALLPKLVSGEIRIGQI